MRLLGLRVRAERRCCTAALTLESWARVVVVIRGVLVAALAGIGEVGVDMFMVVLVVVVMVVVT